MNERVKQEYQQIINRLLTATDAKRLNWKRQNPTTFYFDKDDAIISLQKLQGHNTFRIMSNYVFMIKKKNGEIALQINTSNEDIFQTLLQQLYDRIEFNIESENLDFLKGLIDDI